MICCYKRKTEHAIWNVLVLQQAMTTAMVGNVVSYLWECLQRNMTSHFQHYSDVIKASRHWSLWGEFPRDRWIPRIKSYSSRKWFHLMTSSWRTHTKERSVTKVLGRYQLISTRGHGSGHFHPSTRKNTPLTSAIRGFILWVLSLTCVLNTSFSSCMQYRVILGCHIFQESPVPQCHRSRWP